MNNDYNNKILYDNRNDWNDLYKLGHNDTQSIIQCIICNTRTDRIQIWTQHDYIFGKNFTLYIQSSNHIYFISE